jgi:hypothetical protein
VLAGQNEAGKSAILMALRDFDLKEGDAPLTPEFMPEGNNDAKPEVAVLFEVDPASINDDLVESNFRLPDAVVTALKANPQLWVHRDLLTGKFTPSPDTLDRWPANLAAAQAQTTQGETTESKAVPVPLHLEAFGAQLRPLWPQFVYFDSFQDQLPRQIAVEPLAQHLQATKNKQTPPAAQPGQSSVEDFLELAGIDLTRVIQLKDQDKNLGNYLQGRTATITGDFLTYWKQSVDGSERVELQVRHMRNAQGVLQFAFYVHDVVDQYPEQRSKGFLWFLSFYLRLAAEERRRPDSTRLLLIDEPGTYLHAKAQKDVLHIIEAKLAATQQVIYSTHSPYLLPVEKLHRLRIVLRHGRNGTIIVDRLTHPVLRGNEFSDTLSPILMAIGLDIRERIGGLQEKNLLVEGFSDHTYLTSWAPLLKSAMHTRLCIFPGTGAGTLTTLASLCIGWGLDFSVLVDRDDEGLKTARKFERELGVDPKRIIHPKSAVTIEDLFEPEEFQLLLAKLDPSLKMESGETASKAIKRLGIDKILLARKFAESPGSYPKSKPAFERLFQDIENSFKPFSQ